MEDTQKIKVSKLDAARRQLRMAIELWFDDRDAVAIHTLIFACYQIIYDLNKARGTGANLLFDGKFVPEEYREEMISAIKSHGTFFKHANRNPHGVTVFNPELNKGYIFSAIAGLQEMGEQLEIHERAFVLWMRFTHPELFTESPEQWSSPASVDSLRG